MIISLIIIPAWLGHGEIRLKEGVIGVSRLPSSACPGLASSEAGFTCRPETYGLRKVG